MSPVEQRMKRWSFPVLTFMSLDVFFLSELLFETFSSSRIPVPLWKAGRCLCAMCYPMGIKPAYGRLSMFWSGNTVRLLSCTSIWFPFDFRHINSGGAKAHDRIFHLVEVLYTKKRRTLILQGIYGALFLGLCILACFTAFYRTEELYVLPISASLMGAFFVLLDVNAGVLAGSFFCLSPSGA